VNFEVGVQAWVVLLERNRDTLTGSFAILLLKRRSYETRKGFPKIRADKIAAVCAGLDGLLIQEQKFPVFIEQEDGLGDAFENLLHTTGGLEGFLFRFSDLKGQETLLDSP